jgi:hypothetical protein
LFSSTTKTLVAAVALVAAGMASANTIVDGSYPGIQESPGSFGIIFNSAAAMPATMNFDLLGFLSLDGAGNFYTDVFTLTVNGTSVFSGTFNMGGGGTNQIFSAPAGTTWSTIANPCVNPSLCSPGINWNGGTTSVSALPISLVKGSNTVIFSYDSLTTGGNHGPQTIADEGWGVGHYVISSVPEPETYAMLLAGLGIIGAITRRRRKA